jgi:hypothetical protein
MGLNRAEFQVAVKTSFDGAGNEQAIASHRSLHEALELVKDSAGDALGPIGELAHFLANPYVLAVSGAMLAIKMLVDEHQAMLKQFSDQLVKSREVADMFRDNYRTAVLEANDAVIEFRRSLAAVGADFDFIQDHLKNYTALLDAQTTATNSLAAAQHALVASRIQAGVDAGVTSGPEAAHMQEQERRRMRAAQESTADQQFAAEQGARQLAAKQEAREMQVDSDAAEFQRQQQINADAGIKDAQGRLDKATAARPGLHDTAAQDLAKYMDLQSILGVDASKRLYGMIQHGGAQAEEAQRMNPEFYSAYTKARRSHTADNDNEGVIKKETESVHRLTQESKTAAEQFAQLSEEAIAAKKALQDLTRQIEQAAAVHGATVHGRGTIDDLQDETARVNRRNYLQEKANKNQLTHAEAQEYSGMNVAGVSAAATKTERAIHDIENNIRFQGGHASAAQLNKLLDLNDYMIGLLENIHGTDTHQTNRIDALEQKVNALIQNNAVNRPLR